MTGGPDSETQGVSTGATMKAVVRRGLAMTSADVAVPVPRTGQVLLRTLACGICGSDLHMVHQAREFAEVGRQMGVANLPDPDADLVLGHEICGEIVGYGPHTKAPWPVGTRVAAFPRRTDGKTTESVGFSTRTPGGYAEYLVVDAATLVPVPDGVTDAEAAMAEPFAVGLHAVRRAGVRPGDVAIVIGCGAVGLAVIAALRIEGLTDILVSDFGAERRDVALKMGASQAVDPQSDSPFAHWPLLKVPPRNVIIFECVGIAGVIQQLVAGAPPHSTIIVVGVCMSEDRFLPYQALHKELNIRFSSAYSFAEFRETLGHIAQGRIDLAPVVTDVVGREGAIAAFRPAGGMDGQVKVVLQPSRA